MANNVIDAAIRLRDLFTPTVRSVNASLGTNHEDPDGGGETIGQRPVGQDGPAVGTHPGGCDGRLQAAQ